MWHQEVKCICWQGERLRGCEVYFSMRRVYAYDAHLYLKKVIAGESDPCPICIHMVCLSFAKRTLLLLLLCFPDSPLLRFPKKEMIYRPTPPRDPYLSMLGHQTGPSTHRLRQLLTVTPPLVRSPPQLHIRHLQHIVHRRVHNLATDNRNHRRRILGDGFRTCMGVGGRLGLVVRGLGVGRCVFFEELHAP